MCAASAATTAPSLADQLVAAHFAIDGNDLVVAGQRATSLAHQFGTPLYVYDGQMMRKTYQRLAAALDGLCDIYYSIKANPNPAIASLFVSEGAGLEIASAGEYDTARLVGCPPNRILFAGPGKSDHELDHVIRNGIGEIHLESFEEIAAVAAIAKNLGRTVDVAIRINPAAAVQGGAMRMGGKPAAFGFDEELLPTIVDAVTSNGNLTLTGLHLFTGTQILDASTLLTQWSHAIALARDVIARTGQPLKTIDFGGGLGIPYHAGDKTLDLEAVTAGLPDLRGLRASEPGLRNTRLIVEPGRFLTGQAGIYLTSVLSQKTSRGTRFIVTDGGMHHHLAASGNLGQVVKRDYPIVPANKMSAHERDAAVVTGPLCTPLDTIGRQTVLPSLERGDLIAILQSGAYGLTASPVYFLGHPLPAEVLIDGNQTQLIRSRGAPMPKLVEP